MNRIFYFSFLLFFGFKAFPQGEANIWYIQGTNGIDFNSGSAQVRSGFVPCSIDRDGQSISDANGHLLFYTDGFTVYDRNNQVMQNGTGLLAGGWQVLTAQQPGSNSKYYIFYVWPDYSGKATGNKLYYTVVDMSLNNGLGAVTNAKNVFLKDSVTQKLGTTIHRNGSDIWINAHCYHGNTFYSFLLNNAGISNSPVRNQIGRFIDSTYLATPGQMRSSPDGGKLVMANPVDTFFNGATASSIEFFSFDNLTGQMSNPIFIRIFGDAGAYGLTGVEFSPNGRLVYSCNATEDSISYYQYNVCDFTQQAVQNSQVEIFSMLTNGQLESYDLQLAPDNKIYSINYASSFLNVIDKPDNPGLACSFIFNGFNTGVFNGFTLPYFSNAIVHSISKGRFTAKNTCLGLPTNFGINEIVDSVKWDFGEPSSGVNNKSKLLNPAHTFQAVGSYTVTAILFTQCYKDTLSKKIDIVSTSSKFLGNDISLCGQQTLTLYAGIPDGNYTWQDGSTNNSYNAMQPGKYWVRVDQNGCTVSDTVNLTYKMIPNVSLGNDTTLCIGNSITLNAGNNGLDFIWDDNSVQQIRVVTNAGKYWVTVNENGCSATDTIACTFITGPNLQLGNDTTLCAGQKLVLNSGNNNSTTTYLWNNNTTADTLLVSNTGKYWVNAKGSGCITSDTIQVVYNPVPDFSLGADTTICDGNTFLLIAPPAAGNQFRWQDNSTTNNFNVTGPGTYFVKVINQFSCSSTDSVVINYRPRPVFNLGNDTMICSGQTLKLSANIAQKSYLWNTGSNSSTVTVNAPGLYWLRISDQGCASSDSILINLKTAPIVNLGNDTTLCDGQTLLLNVSNNNASYLWQDGSTQSVYSVNSPGTYSVKVDLDGCDTIAKLNVDYTTKPIVNIGTDTTLCVSQKLLLNAYFPKATYEWQDGSTAPEYTATADGIYSVQVKNTCGITDQSIAVKYENCACKFYIPSAFTPNNDGKNDVFRPKYQCVFNNYELKIFNRWGQMVFISHNADNGWDGTFKGQQQPIGGYAWVLEYQDLLRAKLIRQNGTIVLIR